MYIKINAQTLFVLFGINKKKYIFMNYEPIKRDNNLRLMTSRPSAWGDIPTILLDIIERFDIKRDKALEFGVEFGYSTSAIANYFDKVVGVDTFEGDIHSGNKSCHYEMTKNDLLDWPNIELIKSDYQTYIKENDGVYDLIHVDIIHDYKHTYECGEWSVNHSRVVIFHDTESFAEVRRACDDLCKNYNLEFYNYTGSYGLGILVNRSI